MHLTLDGGLPTACKYWSSHRNIVHITVVHVLSPPGLDLRLERLASAGAGGENMLMALRQGCLFCCCHKGHCKGKEAKQMPRAGLDPGTESGHWHSWRVPCLTHPNVPNAGLPDLSDPSLIMSRRLCCQGHIPACCPQLRHARCEHQG